MSVESMTADRQIRLARRLGFPAAIVALVCVVLMVADAIAANRRAPADEARLLALEEQVRTDAETAPALEAERERQTDASLVRERRNRSIGLVLTVAAIAALACGKWAGSLRPHAGPDPRVLVAQRLEPSGVSLERLMGREVLDTRQGIDLAFVDDLVQRLGTSREAAIPILQAIQSHYRYLPEEALRRVCETTAITPAQVAGTSSFYAQFRSTPVGRYLVRVCHGTACHVAGVQQVTDELHRHFAVPAGDDTDPRRNFTFEPVACIGCCSLAPVMMIEDETAGRLSPASACQTLDSLVPDSVGVPS